MWACQAELDLAKLEIEQAGGNALRIRADVRDLEQMCAAVDRVHAVFGALDVLSLATDLFPDFTDLYFLYGVALMQLGDSARLDDIRLAFEHCLTLGEPDPTRYESVPGVGSFRAQHNLGVLYESLGQMDVARTWYSQAAGQGFDPSKNRLRGL